MVGTEKYMVGTEKYMVMTEKYMVVTENCMVMMLRSPRPEATGKKCTYQTLVTQEI